MSPFSFTALRAVVAALALIATPPPPAVAQGVPVIDNASIAQAIAQIDQMRQDYQVQLQHLASLEAQLRAMTGPRAISGLFNGGTERAGRAAAESLEAVMQNAMTGAAIPGNAAALTARIDALKAVFDLPDLSGLLASALALERTIATEAGAAMAAMATAEDTYRRAGASMSRVTALLDGIDGNPDLKSSMDYSTRMMGEVAVLLNESLRVQAAMANALGSQAAAHARDAAAQQRFMRTGDGP